MKTINANVRAAREGAAPQPQESGPMRTLLLAGCLLTLAAVQAGAQCLGDFNGDGKVTIDELITAVDNALNGCPGAPTKTIASPPSTLTPTPTVQSTPTATPPAARLVDNGDGTISDRGTGLMWEKKDNLDGQTDYSSNPHDADNWYQWSSSPGGSAADGSVFTDFLSKLNACVSADFGFSVTGGFAGHCDWRLPTITELQTIIDTSDPHCDQDGTLCIFQALGPTNGAGPGYWSSTADAQSAPNVFGVLFNQGGKVYDFGKSGYNFVRAVRGGS